MNAKSVFIKKLEKRLIGFEKTTIEKKFRFPGKISLVKKEPGIWFFVILGLHSIDADKFTIEIGWSKLERFPQLSPFPYSYFPLIIANEYACRLSWLSEQKDRWWKLRQDEEYLESVAEEIQELLREAAFPHFEKARNSML